MKKYIRIEKIEIKKKKILKWYFSKSQNVNKYFLKNNPYIVYDEEIDESPASILNIPAISSIIMLSWHIGADVYVDEIDKTYLESLKNIKTVMERWYPKLPFSNIRAEKIITNNFSNDNYGMLFSGGIDSMDTYIRNRNNKPNLIHCNIRTEHFKSNKDHIRNFAEKEKVKLNFVNTNIMDSINEYLLTAKFGISWFGQIIFGMLFTSLCAPITNVNKIKSLLIASSLTEEFKHPWGSHPELDNKIAWNGCYVFHDGFEFSRQEKIKNIHSYIKNNKTSSDHILKTLALVPDHCITERLINKSGEKCGKCKDFLNDDCEKCLRNIAGLALEGINPNECGFNIDKDIFNLIKMKIIECQLYKRKLLIPTKGELISNQSELFFWDDIQKNISEKCFDYNIHNSRDFFKWLKDFNLSEYNTKIKISDLPRLTIATASFHLYPMYCTITSNNKNSVFLEKITDAIYKKII